jgi:hypothetical protein
MLKNQCHNEGDLTERLFLKECGRFVLLDLHTDADVFEWNILLRQNRRNEMSKVRGRVAIEFQGHN